MVVPRAQHDRPHEVVGGTTVMMTVVETRELRDRLSSPLQALEQPEAAAAARPVLVRVDEHHCEGESHQVTIGDRSIQATIGACLQQWTEPGSTPELEVLVEVLGDPMALNPAQAREAAAKLHRIANVIQILAKQAGTVNEAITEALR